MLMPWSLCAAFVSFIEYVTCTEYNVVQADKTTATPYTREPNNTLIKNSKLVVCAAP